LETIEKHFYVKYFGGKGGVGKRKHAVYEVVWENMIEPDRPQMTVLYGSEYDRARQATDDSIIRLRI
jgi:hypothetical protein